MVCHSEIFTLILLETCWFTMHHLEVVFEHLISKLGYEVFQFSFFRPTFVEDVLSPTTSGPERLFFFVVAKVPGMYL